MASLAEIALRLFKRKPQPDIEFGWTDEFADPWNISGEEAYLVQYFYTKLLWLEKLDGATRTSIHQINEVTAMAIVDKDTEPMAESSSRNLFGVETLFYFPERDVAHLFQRH